MEKENTSSASYQLLKTIITNYSFFFKAISYEKIMLENNTQDEINSLVDERDFFSFKQLMYKSGEQEETQ
jgi:hypothetical protein